MSRFKVQLQGCQRGEQSTAKLWRVLTLHIEP